MKMNHFAHFRLRLIILAILLSIDGPHTVLVQGLVRILPTQKLRFYQKYQFSSSHFIPSLPIKCFGRCKNKSNIPDDGLSEKPYPIVSKIISFAFSFLLVVQTNAIGPALAKDFPVFEEVWTLAKDNFFDGNYNGNDWNQVRLDTLQHLNEGSDEQKEVKSMLKLLGDKYTRLLDKNSYESLWKFDAIGVGLLFQSDDRAGRIYVSAPPISGSSGDKAGIRAGDIIYAVNEMSTNGKTAIQLLDSISNDEREELVVEYGRPGDEISGASHRKAILRRTLQGKATNPVKYSLVKLKDGKKLGYISMKEFNSLSSVNMKNALVDLTKQGVDILLLDLRGNTGGGFQFALNIGGMFMNDEVMVSAAGKSADFTVFKTSFPDGVVSDKPLVIATDGLSASASEVLVAGLRDNCRAAVIGERTFGKGKIQAVFGLKDGEGVTMTVAQYLSPKGTAIQSKGIKPDLAVKVLNPYLNFATGNSMGLDINNIDVEKALDIMHKTCVKPAM